jgi:hypothetical protein
MSSSSASLWLALNRDPARATIRAVYVVGWFAAALLAFQAVSECGRVATTPCYATSTSMYRIVGAGADEASYAVSWHVVKQGWRETTEASDAVALLGASHLHPARHTRRYYNDVTVAARVEASLAYAPLECFEWPDIAHDSAGPVVTVHPRKPSLWSSALHVALAALVAVLVVATLAYWSLGIVHSATLRRIGASALRAAAAPSLLPPRVATEGSNGDDDGAKED